MVSYLSHGSLRKLWRWGSGVGQFDETINDIEFGELAKKIPNGTYRIGIFLDSLNISSEADETNNRLILGSANQTIEVKSTIDVYANATPFNFKYNTLTKILESMTYRINYTSSPYASVQDVSTIDIYLVSSANGINTWYPLFDDVFYFNSTTTDTLISFDYTADIFDFGDVKIDESKYPAGVYRLGVKFDKLNSLSEADEANNKTILGAASQTITIGKSTNIRDRVELSEMYSVNGLANDILYITNPNSIIFRNAIIYSIDGGVILNCKIENNSIELNSVCPGLYILKLNSYNGETIHKFIKQ